MPREKRTHQADVVTFELIKEDDRTAGWAILHVPNEGIYWFSNSNNWTINSFHKKIFASLHAAVNYAKKRGFQLLDVPMYSCYIDEDDVLNVALNDTIIDTYENVKSEKQVADIMKENYAVNLNKMGMLL